MTGPDECEGCGSTPTERTANKPDEPLALRVCPHCGATKCCMCDMGDDVECASCVDGCDD